jgi:hypothetical protein
MGIKPRIVVANPPFAEDGDTQRATEFIKRALSWLEEGAQFAFVLPQSFLTSTTHGVLDVRRLLSEHCRIFEVWRFPEGTVGIEARQAVCVVSGSVGKPKIIVSTAARAIISGANISEIRDSGFLGSTWISQLDSENWSSVTAPNPTPTVPTGPLGKLFYVFSGVNPGKLGKLYKPVRECPSEDKCKRYWRLSWRKNRLWADPANVNDEESWLRYGKKFLESSRLEI